MRSRTTLGMGVMVALAIAVWAAVTAGGNDQPVPTSTPATSPSSTTTEGSTTTTPLTTTTVPTSTSAVSTTSTTDPEARIEEVRLILEDLWFRWFDAVYRNDRSQAEEVVATPHLLESFDRAAAAQNWDRGPNRDDVSVTQLEILRDSPTCLVTYSAIDLGSWLGEGTTSAGVDVLYDYGTSWRFASHWVDPKDLWEADCISDRSENLP